jgi:hypothetical protein
LRYHYLLLSASTVTFCAGLEFHEFEKGRRVNKLKNRLSVLWVVVSCDIFRLAQRLKPFGSLIIATEAQFFSSQSCCIIANSFQPPKKEIVSL